MVFSVLTAVYCVHRVEAAFPSRVAYVRFVEPAFNANESAVRIELVKDSGVIAVRARVVKPTAFDPAALDPWLGTPRRVKGILLFIGGFLGGVFF